jgi:hypothetical protein
MVDWFARAIDPQTGGRWSLWNDFYNRDFDILEHTNGASYLVSVGVNQRTQGWDTVILKAPGDGNIYVHHYFAQGRYDGYPDKAASVAMEECKPASALAGYLNVGIGIDNKAARAGEGGLFGPHSFFVAP